MATKKRKESSLKKIGSLIKMGTPFNPKTVSFETLQIAQNMGKTTRTEMLQRPEAGATPRKKKKGYR